jgi:hypothetical protein
LPGEIGMIRFLSKNTVYCLIVLIFSFSATHSQPKKSTFKDFFKEFKTALKYDNIPLLANMIHFKLLKLKGGPEGDVLEYFTDSKFLSDYKEMEFVKYKEHIMKLSADKCKISKKAKMYAMDMDIETDENTSDPWTQMTVEVAKDIPKGTIIYEMEYKIKPTDEYPCTLKFAKLKGEFKLFCFSYVLNEY